MIGLAFSSAYNWRLVVMFFEIPLTCRKGRGCMHFWRECKSSNILFLCPQTKGESAFNIFVYTDNIT